MDVMKDDASELRANRVRAEAGFGVDEKGSGVDEKGSGVDEARSGVDEARSGVDEGSSGSGMDEAGIGVDVVKEAARVGGFGVVGMVDKVGGAGDAGTTEAKAFVFKKLRIASLLFLDFKDFINNFKARFSFLAPFIPVEYRTPCFSSRIFPTLETIFSLSK